MPRVILLCVNHMANLLNLHFICFLSFEESLLIKLFSLFPCFPSLADCLRHLTSINRVSVHVSLVVISVAEGEELMMGQSLLHLPLLLCNCNLGWLFNAIFFGFSLAFSFLFLEVLL